MTDIVDGGTGANLMPFGPGVVIQPNIGQPLTVVGGPPMTWVSNGAGSEYGTTEQNMINDLRDRVNGIIDLLKLLHAIPG